MCIYSKLNSKHLYTMLLNEQAYCIKPYCIKYWEQKLNVSNILDLIFKFKLKNRILNKLGQFQFNLLYHLVLGKKELT